MKKTLLISTVLLMTSSFAQAGESCHKEKKDCAGSSKTVYSGNVYAPNMQVVTTGATLPVNGTKVVEEVQKVETKVVESRPVLENNKAEHQNIQIVCAPQEKVVYKPKIVYRDRVVEKIVYRDREVIKEVPVVKEVVKEVQVPKEVQMVKIVEKPVTKVVEKRIVEKADPKRNALSLIGVAATTRLRTQQSENANGGIVRAENEYEGDIGLMYQHDFDLIRFSIGGTVGGTGLLGLGLVF